MTNKPLDHGASGGLGFGDLQAGYDNNPPTLEIFRTIDGVQHHVGELQGPLASLYWAGER